tara:strand:+ start:11325 stop:11870 length:546 start_codon:yes stop_codon:yes gene_type:complete
MASINFRKSLLLMLKSEGGFQKDKRDTGNSGDGHGNQGSTNFGVTAKVWAAYTKKPAPIEVMQGLSHDLVAPLYKTEYWDKCKCSSITLSGVDFYVFDIAVNSGVSRASKMLQKIISVKEDGIIGIKTLEKLNSQDAKEIIHKLYAAREAFYKKAKGFQHYGKGWLKRNSDCKKHALEMLN